MSAVITGGPGTGKHTVARIYSDITGATVYDAGVIAAEAGLVSESGDVDVSELARIFPRDITAPYCIIGHLVPYVLESSDAPVFILRRSPYELEQVYEGRGYPESKALGNVQAEILGITSHDAISRFEDACIEIDATGKKPEDIANIMAGFQGSDPPGGRRGMHGGVDWLGTIYERGDILRFFPYLNNSRESREA